MNSFASFFLSVSSDQPEKVLSDRGTGGAQCARVYQWPQEQAACLLPLLAQEQDSQGR